MCSTSSACLQMPQPSPHVPLKWNIILGSSNISPLFSHSSHAEACLQILWKCLAIQSSSTRVTCQRTSWAIYGAIAQYSLAYAWVEVTARCLSGLFVIGPSSDSRATNATSLAIWRLPDHHASRNDPLGSAAVTSSTWYYEQDSVVRMVSWSSLGRVFQQLHLE